MGGLVVRVSFDDFVRFVVVSVVCGLPKENNTALIIGTNG
jgi:hypothetical protein